MEKTKYTHGPWRTGAIEPTDEYATNILGGQYDRVLARTTFDMYFDEQVSAANAILISCAPDLLKELKQTVYELKEWRDYWTNEADSFNHPSQEQEYGMCKDRAARLTEQIQAIELLIKKAEGAN